MLSFSRGLWRHQNFILLWAGQTVSLFGTQITTLALPTIAILLLHATPFEVGVLATIPWVAYLGLGLFAGVAVDRMPRRMVMMITDIRRAVALGSIPLAFTLGVRSIYHLYLGFLLGGLLASTWGLVATIICGGIVFLIGSLPPAEQDNRELQKPLIRSGYRSTRKCLLTVAITARTACGANAPSTVGTGPIACSNKPVIASPTGSLPKAMRRKTLFTLPCR